MSTNDELKRISPWLEDTRPKHKGGKAATRTLTSLNRECRQYRDEIKAFSEVIENTAKEVHETTTRAIVCCIVAATGAILANIFTILFYVS